MSAKRFFFTAISILVLVLLLLVFFNGLVDPIRLFAAPEFKGFNYFKPTFFNKHIVSKPYTVSRLRPDGIILGTSRAGASLSTNHPAWDNYRAYNFSIAGSTAMVQWWNFQHANAQTPLRRVLLSLDFFMFNACRDQTAEQPFREYRQRLARGDGSINLGYPKRYLVDHLVELTSLNASRASWQTWQMQPLFSQQGHGLLHLYEDGYWQRFPAKHVERRKGFRLIERQYMSDSWFPKPANCYSLEKDGKKTQLDYLQQLLQQAYFQGTEVILYFSPFHARLAEAMDAMGLWEQFEQLKREVLVLNLSLAKQENHEAYPLWDFSGYTTINVEEVPALNSPDQTMKYYQDGSHATRLTGMLVQDVVFGFDAAATRIPDDVAVQLSAQNIESHLHQTRELREQYRLDHPEDIKEVNRLAARLSR